MTPKEKAKELVEKYFQNWNLSLNLEDAKQCALIAIDEILRVCPYIDEKKHDTEDQLSAFEFQFVSYWQKVKKEIEAL